MSKYFFAAWLLFLAGIFCLSNAVAPIQHAKSAGYGSETIADQPPLGTEQDASSSVFYTALTPSATANTKGSWAALLASSSNVTNSILFSAYIFPNQATPGKGWLVDIGTGSGGSQVVIIPNIQISDSGQYNAGFLNFLIPYSLPASTALWARVQTNQASASDTMGVKLNLFAGGFGAAGVDNLGSLTATSIGTAVVSGNGSKGTYVSLVSSTAHAYKGIVLIFDTQAGSLGNYTTCVVDIATGANPSQVVIIPNLPFGTNESTIFSPSPGYFPVSIPAGTDVWARAECNGSANTFGVSALGIY